MNQCQFLLLLIQSIQDKKFKIDDKHHLRFDWSKIDLQNLKNYVPKVSSDFQWGFTASAIQTEGGNQNSSLFEWSKQLSCPWANAINQWDLKVFDQDMKLASELGADSQRTTIEWSRIYPDKGVVDWNVVAHYRDMLKIMLKYKIDPGVGLWHISFPQWFFDEGEFLRVDNIKYFADFCKLAAENFGDLSTFFTTMSEPNLVAHYAYKTGYQPNLGVSQYNYDLYQLNLIKAHVKCYDAIKTSKFGLKIKVGISLGNNQEEQKYIDQQKNKILSKLMEIQNQDQRGRWYKFFIEGVQKQGYQDQTNKSFTSKLDWIGVNQQTIHVWDYNKQDGLVETKSDDVEWSSYGMAVQAEGLQRSLVEAHQLGIPILVSEIGCPDKELHNLWLKRHVYAMNKQIDEYGDDNRIFGLHWWTLVSNWEYVMCFDLHFGMYDRGVDNVRVKNQGADLFKEIVDYSQSDCSNHKCEDADNIKKISISADKNLDWDWKLVDKRFISQVPLIGKDFRWGFTLSNQQDKNTINHCNRNELPKNTFKSFKNDVFNAKMIGATTLRLILDWSAIQFEKDRINYDQQELQIKMVKQMLSEGIKPTITLTGNILPEWYEKIGGFTIDNNNKYFSQQCRIIADNFVDLVEEISTFNEPNMIVSQYFNQNNTDKLKRFTTTVNVLNSHINCSNQIKSYNSKTKVSFQLLMNFIELKKSSDYNKLIKISSNQYVNKENQIRIDSWLQFMRYGYQKLQNKVFQIENPKKQFDFIGINYYDVETKCQDSLNKSLIDCSSKKESDKDTLYAEGLQRILIQIRKLNLPIIIGENGFIQNNTREMNIKRQMHAIKRQVDESGSENNLIGQNYFTIRDFTSQSNNQCKSYSQGLFQTDKELKSSKLKLNSIVLERIIKESKNKIKI